MIISPPFLPDRAGQSEEAWLDAAMAQTPSRLSSIHTPEKGSIPLSLMLGWHNGLHIQAPKSGGAYLPVRAIADGKVVFVHMPTAPKNDVEHALNYNPFHTDTLTPAWTSDGFIVIEHKTEIGAGDNNAPTQVVYCSACMHLASIAHCPKTNAAWAVGDTVYRKDELGAPGRIYGAEGQIHLEIRCDEANLRRLTRRRPDGVDVLNLPPPAADGRTDSIFGSVYVYLPGGTPTSTSQPMNQLRRVGGSAGMPHTLRNPQWVQISSEKGATTLTSFDRFGAAIGLPRNDSRYDYIPDAMVPAAVGAVSSLSFEYDLHAACNERHRALDVEAQAASSPSGWYELLRFGRNLGADPLPANAAHWRKIVTPTGEAWADLNAPGTFKFSDADFLPVMGWNCLDDDPGVDWCGDQVQLAKRLGALAVRATLRRAICKCPGEWDPATIEARYGWLTAEDFGTIDDDAAGAQKCDRFLIHARAVAFADLPEALLNAEWRFHPREFVGLMRKCGWLSEREFEQLMPGDAFRHAEHLHVGVSGCLGEPISSPSTDTRGMKDLRVPLNRTMRKYLVNTPFRQATFFGNAIIEMQAWRTAIETARPPLTSENSLALIDSAGFCWASRKIAMYADSLHVLERVEVDTVDGQGVNVYYRSPAFWQACAAANRPASITNTYSKALSGFDVRCCVYGYAIAVLTEACLA